ncbi:MAG: sugar ABC transporter permease [Clostridia bacterium]|nr:sugar ABC transporter permease [Clostridia bacterium]
MKNVIVAAAENSARCVINNGFGQKIQKQFSRYKYLYLMAIPVILYYLIFCYLPMGGIVIAFKQYEIAKGIFASEWVGLKFFKEFFSGIYFWRIFKNTLLISFYDLLFSFPITIGFALLLNEIKAMRFKKIVQSVTYLPHFISMVVLCGMIVDFFGKDGVLTRFFMAFGGENVNYLGYAQYFRPLYIGTNIWQSVGWGSIIYLAALAGVDQELYEAAVVDGAGYLKQLWHITLPGIAQTIIVMLILRIGQLVSVGYEKIILLYNSGTFETADVISSYVYRMGLAHARYSFSTAVGLFQSVINLILLIAANTFSKRFSETSLF